MVALLFNILFFLIPLVFFKNTSELFEFNKIIVLYTFTILIVSAWTLKSIRYKKIIFSRTILDIPIIIYLGTLLISTIFSIDQRTSLLGYYSRFNGGLLSQISYILLYFALTGNLNQTQKKQVLLSGLIGTVIASILGIMEHFGVFVTCGLMNLSYTNSCWVQDVQTRVFSTLGQPNWLAALVTIYIPITWYLYQKDRSKLVKLSSIVFSIILFTTLVFTKSRSGLLAFGIEFIIFWGYVFWKEKFKHLKGFLFLTILFTTIFLIFNTSIFTKKEIEATPVVGPALETGGTESGVIRKYVWIGAFNVFKNYPVFGSGVETFAFVFPKFKPVEHNLTSEWDFIYNKAHNEFLNNLATTGLVGVSSYMFLILSSLYYLWKSKRIELLTAYLSILVTNFFGFSVVPVSLLFFLIPAFAGDDNLAKLENRKKESYQLILYLLTILTAGYLLFITYNHWMADINYNKARSLTQVKKYNEAKEYIETAIKLSPSEAIFHSEASVIYSEVTLLDENKNNESLIKENAEKAIDEGVKGVTLAKRNVNNLRILSSTYYKFAQLNNEYLLLAQEPLEAITQIATNDPKVYYQLGILYIKNNKIQTGLENLKRAVILKPNYKEGRFALGLTYVDLKRQQDAINEFEYILNNIDPNDDLTKKYLQQAVNEL